MELIGKNITYKYPSSKKYVLKDVDITLNSDKITGLIGESGKGKSTLCKILSNYIPKYDGEVYLDNQILPKNGFCPVQLIFQHPEKVMNPKWKMCVLSSIRWAPEGILHRRFERLNDGFINRANSMSLMMPWERRA
mgnify:CR=1 FL=1